MASDAQKRANAKYRREKMRQIVVCFYPADMDLYDWVKSQPNITAYVKGLIRADMEERKSK